MLKFSRSEMAFLQTEDDNSQEEREAEQTEP